jgi:hypothetical protein
MRVPRIERSIWGGDRSQEDAEVIAASGLHTQPIWRLLCSGTLPLGLRMLCMSQPPHRLPLANACVLPIPVD